MSAAAEHEETGPLVDYPREASLAEIFARQAAGRPDAVAVVSGESRISYRELDARSDALAARLQEHGVKPATLVGLAVERDATLLVGMLAILKAGGAYVPLDPSYPQERLAWIMEDSGMRVVLATALIRDQLPRIPDGPMVVVADEAQSEPRSSTALQKAAGEDLAYVIYTSGSTGKPKGVMVEQRNVLSFFAGMDHVLGDVPGVWLAVTSVCFDISVLELLWTLTRGFTIVLHGDDGWASIADEIERNSVTHLQMTPSLARMMMLDARAFAALGSLKTVLLGGEAVPASLLHRLREAFKGEIYNMYGPTETTIWSTCGRVEEIGTTVPIGRPIANTQVYLLDPALQPVGRGEAGELWIGGDGVARGYLNRPELTAERFLALSVAGGRRVYRTGDLARLRPDGSLDFLGRNDYQIKLRGHRIELGEIEAALEELQAVRQAVIVLREDREGDQRLVAYVVPDGLGDVDSARLRETLAERLPEYMVPSSFVLLQAMPLTENGKIDRKALLHRPPPSPTQTHPSSSPADQGGSVSGIVARVWREALGVGDFAWDENFFDLGAHSLTVAEVHSKLQEELGRELSLVDLFQFPTVNKLAAHLGGVAAPDQVSDRAQRRRLARQR